PRASASSPPATRRRLPRKCLLWRCRAIGSRRRTSTGPNPARSVHAADAKADDVCQRARVGVGPEDGKRVASDGAVMPGALEGRLDGAVPFHEPHGVLEIAVLDATVAQRALPEDALALI